MDPSQRNYYKTNIAALNLTAALVKKKPLDINEDEVKWPCLETASGKGSSTETSSTTSRDVTSTASNQMRKPFCTIGNSFYIFSALVLFLVGGITIVYTPFNILMNERLKMVRGLPAYEWWKNPPDEVLLRVYLFNVTNSERFENGIDSKLELNEIGPIVFRELLRHSDVRFNDNGTMTYVATRTAVFLPEMTNISLDAKLILPNFAALGMASYLWDASTFTKYGFRLMMNMLETKMFIKTSINDCLWNLTDPLVQKARTMMPSLVPEENMGILHQIYNKFTDEVTVFMGPENGRRFFTVDKYHGNPNLGIWEDARCDSVQGASEGVTYHQFVSKNDTLKYLRKTMCRVTPLRYKNELTKSGMTMYKFVLPHNVYAHPQTDPSLEDCFHNPKSTPLLSGLSDVSPCYYNFPIAASFPHFLNADQALLNSISGLNPSEEKHGSYLIVEPLTGVPVESKARSQSNLVMHPTSGFSNIDKFSDMTIPMFWAEYNQVGLPWYITTLMYFTVNILPYTQSIGSISMMIAGLAMISKSKILTSILVWSGGQCWSNGLIRFLNTYTAVFITMINGYLKSNYQMSQTSMDTLEYTFKLIVCFSVVIFVRWCNKRIHKNYNVNTRTRRSRRTRLLEYNWIVPRRRQRNELGLGVHTLHVNNRPPELQRTENTKQMKLQSTQSCHLLISSTPILSKQIDKRRKSI